jgi:hypothetical protein
LLTRLTNPKVAFVACCLLALDPFYVTYSEVLHPDGLLATFMLVSALFLHCYLRESKPLDMALSGVFAGLALLTKTPAFFLIPYVLAVVTVDRLFAGPDDNLRSVQQRWLWRARPIARALLTWGIAVAVVFVALWPAMWVEPLTMLRRMASNIFRHTATPHKNPRFFNGEITFEDPGVVFYLATIVWKTTSVTLLASCVALVISLIRFRDWKRSGLVWLLAAYAALFTCQMGLGEFKQTSHILPVFPVLDVLAACGAVQAAEAIGPSQWLRRWLWVPSVLIVLVLTVQAIEVLPRHPYYGTHHNVLLGGSRVAQRILPLQDQGEGVDIAARHLNTLPQAQRARAVIHPRHSWLFRRHFDGLTIAGSDPWASYRIYDVNQVMRQRTGEDWDVDRQTTPLWTVAFDGVTYVWVYGSPPDEQAVGGPESEVGYKLGEHIALTHFRLSSETLVPGDEFTVVLFWESDGEVKESYRVFCHLLTEARELAAQRDGPPVYGIRPTPTWRAGEIIEDSYELFLPDDLLPGSYELSIGMYDLETLDRLPAYDAAGTRLAEDRVVLGLLRVDAHDGGQ